MRRCETTCTPRDGLLTYTDEGGVGVATVACAALVERQGGHFYDRLVGIAERRGGRLAVGFANVESVSWECARALCRVQTRCRELGGAMAVYAVSPQVRAAMRASGALGWLTVVEDRGEAVRNVRRSDFAARTFALPAPAVAGAKAA